MAEDFLLKQCIGFLNTPSLWRKEQFGITQFEFPNTDLETFQPKAIPPKIRLGHQMEHVFKQLVEHSPTYEILVYNLPVRRDKQTLGEIDFILSETATKNVIHIELTYKFYIINPEITEPIHRLMGPNKRDMFFTKMEKIKNEQFQLPHSEEGVNALSAHGIEADAISHETCYKGQLYTPYGSSDTYIRPLNQDCICGYWLRFDEFNTAEFKNHQFYIPFKSEWVIKPHTEVQWNSHFEILMDINLRMLKENAPMVWMKKSETEFEKFFVVWWK